MIDALIPFSKANANQIRNLAKSEGLDEGPFWLSPESDKILTLRQALVAIGLTHFTDNGKGWIIGVRNS